MPGIQLSTPTANMVLPLRCLRPGRDIQLSQQRGVGMQAVSLATAYRIPVRRSLSEIHSGLPRTIGNPFPLWCSRSTNGERF